ncbi:phage virion morphogenesis protein [Pseudodesulfovibrio sp.]|uniref:phage virion morphogenesis protein n=1 Tax=unclassified Pseudodesulfovibrio TaxID=2661612 RepID=UPI003B00AD34
MGGTSFKLDWGGLDKVLGSAVSKAGQSKAAMEEIGEMLTSSTVERFDSSTGPDGEAWPISQRAEKEGGKTLVDTGRLRGSIGYEASPDQVVVGSNLVYSRIHQLGGEAGRGHSLKLPPRPYLGISQGDIKEARAILADHLARILGGGK